MASRRKAECDSAEEVLPSTLARRIESWEVESFCEAHRPALVRWKAEQREAKAKVQRTKKEARPLSAQQHRVKLFKGGVT